jgi:hypothetical protein
MQNLFAIKLKGGIILATVEDIPKYSMEEVPSYFTDEKFIWDEDRFYFRISKKPYRFFVMDTYKHQLEELIVTRNDDRYDESRQDIVADFSVEDAKIYLPFSDKFDPKYGFTAMLRFGAETKKVKISPENVSDIVGQLDKWAVIGKPNKAKEIITNLLRLLKNFNLLKETKQPPWPGFYTIDGKFTATVEYDNPEKTKLREALKELEELATHFEPFKEQLNFILHWHIIAPFSFYKKMQDQADKVGAVYMYGSSRAGKTILAQLGAHIYGQRWTDQMVGAGKAHSVASLGYNISQSTFAVTLDEAEQIFSRGNEEILAMLKNAIHYLEARGKYNTITMQYENIPALAPLIITSNKTQPSNASIGARLHSLEFTMKKNRSNDEIIAFNDRFEPESDKGPLRKLSAIGSHVANHLETFPNILELRWKEASEILWKAVYEDAGMDIPEWLDGLSEVASGLEEAWEEEDIETYENFRKLVLRQGVNIPRTVDTDTGEFRQISVKEIIDYVAKGRKEPWISYRTYKGEELIEIAGSIRNDLIKDANDNTSLKLLAHKFGGKHFSTTRLGRRVWVAQWKYNDFVELMSGKEDSEET